MVTEYAYPASIGFPHNKPQEFYAQGEADISCGWRSTFNRYGWMLEKRSRRICLLRE